MRHSPQRFRNPVAFTLLEVMLAVTILGIVILVITGTWNAGLNGWKHTVGISDSFQRERVVMTTLADLTKSIVFAPSEDALYEITFARDQQSGASLSFVTASDLLLPKSEAVTAGMRRVTIGLRRDERGRPYLGIANTPALAAADTTEAAEHVLSAEVCGLGIRFRNPRDGTWKDEWDEPKLLPSAIEYTVAFGANDGRTPPVVVTRSVELPVAPYALLLLGQPLAQGNTTNTVTRREIELTTPSGGGETDTESDTE